MASSRNITIIFAAAGFLCVLCTIEAIDTSKIHLICSGDLFHSIYSQMQLSKAIGDILAHTSNRVLSNNYYVHQTCEDSDVVCDRFKEIYGHGKCSTTLSEEDCKSCMGEANKQLFHECTRSMGAQIQLKDCRLRYETYMFRDDE